MTRRPVAVPGWDSDAEIVDERYVERTPRRPSVRRGLERECHNLPLLAPLLPLAVPVPSAVPADSVGPWRVRHELVPGTAADPASLTHREGAQVGAFLRALHDLDPDHLGLEVSPDDELTATTDRMTREVLPLLDRELRESAEELLARVLRPTPLVVAHGDLGPEHVLVEGDGVSGIIDWTDSALRDPAIDLSWVLHGTSEAFRAGVLDCYGPAIGEIERARDWHLLGPWHEVLWGIDEGGAAAIVSGLAGTQERLRAL